MSIVTLRYIPYYRQSQLYFACISNYVHIYPIITSEVIVVLECVFINPFSYTVIQCFISSQKDIPENGADIAHLKTVHETGVQAGTGVDYNLSKWLGRMITHHWEVGTCVC